jgi:nucleoside-diphosphate-sugar epimerase
VNGKATVAVTGANGFIGRQVVLELRRRGHTTRPLVRAVDANDEDGVAVGDLAGAVNWTEALAQVECVVHCAGMAHIEIAGEADDTRATQINAEATRALALAAAAAGARRLIYLSSAKVMGESSGARAWNEADAIAPADPYSRSKAAAELALAEVAAATGLGVTILRPPLVYGPGVRANFLRLMSLADTTWPLPLASATAPRSMVYVGNLVDATIACMVRQEAVGQTFFVTDGDDLSIAQLVGALRACLGRPRRLVRCPIGLLRQGAAVLGRKDQIGKLAKPFRCSCERLQGALGWRPPVPVAQALRITVDWYRVHGGSGAGRLR